MSGPDVLPPEMRRTLRLLDRTDPLGLDEQTSGRLLGRAMRPDDAPPAYRGVARLFEALAQPGPELTDSSTAIPAIAAAFASSPQPRTRRSAMSRKLLSKTGVTVAALAGGLSLFGGLAAAGARPGVAQGVASDVLSNVGVSVPNPNSHASDHSNTGGSSSNSSQAPDTTKGAAISNTARTTDSTGADNGAVISSQASDGKSQAGADHPSSPTPPTSTPPSLPTQATTPSQADNGLNHRP